MTSDESPDRLIALLDAAGVDRSRPAADDVDAAWRVMRAFADERVDDISEQADSDGLLAQYGTYDWGDGEHFQLDMTRQYAFDDEDGEYSHMAQLRCTFLFTPDQELRALGSGNLWSFELPLDTFFAQALALEGFVGARGRRPLRLEVDYSEI